MTDGEINALVSADVRRQWCEDVIGSDPISGDTGQLRAPTGVLKDFRHCAATGEPWYHPEAIKAPVQIVVGELDRETTPAQCQEVFNRLTSAETKRMTIIGSGTHTLLLEDRRRELYQVAAAFLLG